MAKSRSATLWRTQNILRSRSIIEPILSRSEIAGDDLVLDVGAGAGVITRALRARDARVMAIEQDPLLCRRLRDAFDNDDRVRIVCDDFLSMRLPKRPYKVFASVPFDITTAIVSKLVDASNPPEDAFLVVQREAAARCLGHPTESLYSLLFKPWFQPVIVHRFRREDFRPVPSVDAVMLRVRKRGPPLVPVAQRELYRNFMIAIFTAWRPSVGDALRRTFGHATARRLLEQVPVAPAARPSDVYFAQWLDLFAAFSRRPDAVLRMVGGSERRLRAQQRRVHKHHRSRAPRDDLGSRQPRQRRHDRAGGVRLVRVSRGSFRRSAG